MATYIKIQKLSISDLLICFSLDGHARRVIRFVGIVYGDSACCTFQDESVEGVLTILCNHSFHGSCLSKWSDTT